jgi:hypothetical protein
MDPVIAAAIAGSAHERVVGAPGWVPVQVFLDCLRRAVDGVVRVSIGNAGCTGWLITPTLVVVPHYVLGDAPQAPLECLLPAEPDHVEAVLEFLPTDAPDVDNPGLPALIRLSRSFPGRALPLATTSAVPGEAVVLLHHPLMVVQTQISQGRVLDAGPERLTHDIPSTAGSGGAPVIRVVTGEVLGLHWGRHEQGFGTGLSAVLAVLRGSSAWPEIARAHRLADVRAAPAPGAASQPQPPQPQPQAEPALAPAEALLRAAITWTIDPNGLSPADRAGIRPWIDDPDEPTWSLPTEERRRLIGSAGSLDALRAVHEPGAEPGPGGATVARILAGPPYDLDDVPDEELPYWLQAVSWFDQLLPLLPRPADVHRVLSSRRIRSRLQDSTSPVLWGRDDELETLRSWFGESEPPPMVVTGIGGIGKSALVARFALDLPSHTVILWLDFDRADLTPDNAVSVVAALVEQLAVQRDGFVAPPVDASSWPAVATALSTALSGAGALLVLDGFEVAQHVHRHEELWDVLAEVVGRTDTRVLISGRAPVPGLALVGREARTLELTGIPEQAASAWLAERGVTDSDVVGRVLRAARGLPLLLKLSLRLLEAGGDVPSTLERLPRELVSGYLYRRILNRVGTATMRRLARDALVLRRLTPDVVAGVLADRIPAGLDPDRVVALLGRELALVEAATPAAAAPAASAAVGGWLRMRPDVRVATLQLLEIENQERTRLIDQRAAVWYAGRGHVPAGAQPDQLTVAAERVYHLCRLGDVDAADAAWLDGCEELLAGAHEEVPDAFPAAREWLRRRVSGHSGPPPESAVVAWEREALLRIRDAFGRGLDRAIPAFLQEGAERSPQSPLLVYDAWTLRGEGRVERARALLQEAPAVPGPIGWGRAIVAARTAALDGDPVEADRLLAEIDLTAGFIEPDHALAVTAARIRLALDLPAEARALEVGSRGGDAYGVLREVLTPWDLVLPTPRGFLSQGSYHVLPELPDEPRGASSFAEAVDAARRQTMRRGVGLRTVLLPPDVDRLPSAGGEGTPLGLASWLADLSVRRWRFAAHTSFLVDVRRSVERSRFTDQVRLSLAGTLAVFWPADLRYRDGMPLVEVARRAAESAGATRADPEASERLDGMRAVLESVIRADPKSGFRASLPLFIGTGPFLWASLPSYGWQDGSNCALLVALGPDPLEELERRVLGQPELKAK